MLTPSAGQSGRAASAGVNRRARRPFSLADIAWAQWFEADSGFYQDAARTTPALAANDPVGGWPDKSTNGRHFSQSTAGRRALLQKNALNGYDSLLFDGVDDFLTSTGYTLNQPFTVFVVLRQVTWTISDVIIAGSADTGTRIRQQPATPSIGLAYSTNAAENNNLAVGDWGILRAVVNGASSQVAVNSNPPTTGDAGAVNPAGVTLGARPSAAAAANIEVVAVLVYNGLLGAAMTALVEAALDRKYGLSTPTATYYVDATGGNDSNTGLSAAQAWKTVAKVNASRFQPGDSIVFKYGEIWYETLTIGSNGSFANPLRIGAYGNAALALPVIEGGSTRATCIDLTGRTYITIEDIKVHAPTASGLLFSGIGTFVVNRVIADASGDQNVQHLGQVTVTYNDCVFSNAADDGISMHDGNVVANRCTFSGNVQGINTSTTAATLVVNDSVFSGNGTDNVLCHATTAATFNRCKFGAITSGTHAVTLIGSLNYCIFDMSGAAGGQTVGIIATSGVGTLNARNCTFYGGAGAYGSISVADSYIINLVNCLFYSVWRVGSITGTGQINADHCLFNAVGIKALTSNTNELTSDPLLVNAAAGNFHLQAGSPARGAGVAVGGLTIDYDGVSIPNPPAIGAYEYVA